MNLRQVKHFNTLYGGEKRKRVRIELPEERDAKIEAKEAKALGFKKIEDYREYKRKKAEAKKYGGRSSGRFRTAKARQDKKSKIDYSPGSGNYFRG